MKIIRKISMPVVASLGLALVMASCGASGEDTGYEYMPNMYRSPSYETYGENELYENNSNALMPVEHTIPRGHVPFDYENTPEGFALAGAELTNPITDNAKMLAEGKVLYSQFCAHCHGKKGDGKGTITNPIYGGVPAYQDNVQIRRSGGTMADMNDGQIYHTITFGLNAMGPHASQLMPEERWKIVRYVHELQKGNK